MGNVEFRLGGIERLFVAEGSVGVILSNCVINLSPDKSQVFAEAFRVLRPRGRLGIPDVVALIDLTEEMRQDPAPKPAVWPGPRASTMRR
jgi:ubiquinone/menaquinone biosynthesis C-methylase UbiE